MDKRRIALVGCRSAAVEAAVASGFSVVVVAPTQPIRRTANMCEQVILADITGGAEEVANSCMPLVRAAHVDGIVAITEDAVEPTALLAARLGLPGHAPALADNCRDKLRMKEHMSRAGIPCADIVAINRTTQLADLVARLGFPVVIKQRASSGSRGLGVAHNEEELKPLLRPGWIAEAFVTGTEMSVESFVVDGQVAFTNTTEYLVNATANVLPAPLPPLEQEDLEQFNARVIAAMGVQSGITHLEVFKTPTGLVFGEIALRPPGGYLMDLLALAYGFCPWAAVFDLAMGHEPSFPEQATATAGAWILHPGEGTCVGVGGLEQARATAYIKRVRCRLKAGKHIPIRTGTGQEAAHILAAAPTYATCVGALERAAKTLRFSMITVAN